MTGLLGLSVIGVIIYTLVLTHITIVSVTVYLHRHSAHRALDLHPALSHFFRFWLWLTTSMITKEWTAIHRKHHAHCETEQDPHSPRILGLKTVLTNGAELYNDASRDEAMLEQFGKGTPDDWLERNIYGTKRWFANNWGISLMLVINVLLLGPIGLTVWAIQMLWIPVWAAGVVNGLGHSIGYRNYECKDAATNLAPWGILIGGEELHNNHHTYPNSARLSSRWFEFDLGWQYIRLFKWFGLAKNIRTGPIVHRGQAKSLIDMDTALALANDRFRVMALFKRKVISPMVRQQKKMADDEQRSLFKRAKKLLTREDSLLKQKQVDQLNQLLASNAMMKHLYSMRQELVTVWSKRSQSADELIHAVRDWIEQAEASGIQALEDFALHLRSYSIQPAKIQN